jgi:hypothetical protein
MKETPASPIQTDQEGHEGARASNKPGEPAAREVIPPDWAELEKKTQRGAVKPKTAPPAIDRHR